MAKRRTCNWCGRGPVRCAEHGCISVQSKRDLQSYVREHGRTWRSKLRAEWMHGGDIMRPLRNTIGPSGLATIVPPLHVDPEETRFTNE